MAALEDLPDFYLEMKWNFESNPILSPLVRAIAPSDTYRVWKKGSWLRMDSTISGFSRGFRIVRGDLSLLFQGRGAAYPGDLLRINHERGKVSRVFRRVENPTHMEVERAVSRLIHAANKQLTAVQIRTSDFDFQRGAGRHSSQNISGWETHLYEGLGDVRVINHKKGDNDCSYATAEEYFNPTVSLDGLAFQRRRTLSNSHTNASDRSAARKKKKPNVASSKQRFHLKMKAQMWVSEEFPLNIKQILPALEILATKDKLVQKLNNILNNDAVPEHNFPIKTKLPLILGIHAMVVFQNYSEDPIDDDIFKLPEGYDVKDPLSPMFDDSDAEELSSRPKSDQKNSGAPVFTAPSNSGSAAQPLKSSLEKKTNSSSLRNSSMTPSLTPGSGGEQQIGEEEKFEEDSSDMDWDDHP